MHVLMLLLTFFGISHQPMTLCIALQRFSLTHFFVVAAFRTRDHGFFLGGPVVQLIQREICWAATKADFGKPKVSLSLDEHHVIERMNE